MCLIRCHENNNSFRNKSYEGERRGRKEKEGGRKEKKGLRGRRKEGRGRRKEGRIGNMREKGEHKGRMEMRGGGGREG